MPKDAHNPDRDTTTNTDASTGTDDPYVPGDFGAIEQIETDNATVQAAEGGYTGEELAKGADTDPDIAQGSP